MIWLLVASGLAASGSSQPHRIEPPLVKKAHRPDDEAAPPYRRHVDEPPEEPRVHPTAAWLALQVVPSPALAIGPGPERFGLQWQFTPALFSFALRQGLRPWRFFVAEPHVRHGGSIEAFVSPEVYFGARTSPVLRPGLRGYVPVVSRGELLSLSVGVSFQRFDGASRAAYEAGAHILFGILGLQVSHAPGPATSGSTIVSLRLRYF